METVGGFVRFLLKTKFMVMFGFVLAIEEDKRLLEREGGKKSSSKLPKTRPSAGLRALSMRFMLRIWVLVVFLEMLVV